MTQRGEPLAWVRDVAIPFGGDECLIFPYSRDDYGYGKVRYDGSNIGVHVLVCRERHGEKPTPRHEACHSCGNGHGGCVNPNHIYWGTRAQNMADAMAMGTLKRENPPTGEASPAMRHRDPVIAEVRRLLAAGLRQVEISELTGVSQSHVSRIKHGVRSVYSETFRLDGSEAATLTFNL